MATLRPSSDSDIKIEVWLPMTGWNGSFQGAGNGGWAGTIGYAALGNAVKSGVRRREHRHGARRQHAQRLPSAIPKS